MDPSPSQLAFKAFTVIVVTVVVLFWIPFKAGRRLMALYDLLCGIIIAGCISAATVTLGPPAISLWIPGMTGLFVGILASVPAQALVQYLLGASRRSTAFVALCYFGTLLPLGALTFSGVMLGHWLLG